MSQLEVDKIIPQSGTTLTIGDSGDTVTISAGATLSGSLNADNLDSGTVPDARITGAYSGITNLTMSGDLAINTDTLFVDASADKVGIGTTTLTTGANLTLSGQGFLTTGADSGSIAFGSNASYQGRIYQDNSSSVFYIENTYSSGSGDIRFKTNGSERVTIEGTGNVGIGTSSPSAGLDVVSTTYPYIAEFRQANAGNPGGIVIDSPADNGSRPSFLNLETGGVLKWGLGLGYNDTNRSFHISTSSLGSGITGSKFTITTSGNVGIGTTSPSQELDVVGSIEVSDGIYIGGTAAANKLDDYEEGSFTAEFSSSGATFTYSVRQGYYTKIGNRVIYNIYIQLDGTFTGTANAVTITGLPFTASNSSGNVSSSIAAVRYVNFDSGYTHLECRINNNQNYITLLENGDNVPSDVLRSNQLSNISGQVFVSGSYKTDA